GLRGGSRRRDGEGSQPLRARERGDGEGRQGSAQGNRAARRQFLGGAGSRFATGAGKVSMRRRNPKPTFRPSPTLSPPFPSPPLLFLSVRRHLSSRRSCCAAPRR